MKIKSFSVEPTKKAVMYSMIYFAAAFILAAGMLLVLISYGGAEDPITGICLIALFVIGPGAVAADGVRLLYERIEVNDINITIRRLFKGTKTITIDDIVWFRKDTTKYIVRGVDTIDLKYGKTVIRIHDTYVNNFKVFKDYLYRNGAPELRNIVEQI